MDRYGWSPSADMGLGFTYMFGNFKSSILLTNGDGFKSQAKGNNEKISLKLIYGESRLDENDGYNIGLVSSSYKYQKSSIDYVTNKIFGFFSGWSRKDIRIGFDHHFQKTRDNENNEIFSIIFSLYFNYNINIKSKILLKYDSLDPDDNIDRDDESIIIAGFVWSPVKGLLVCPNIQEKTKWILDKEQSNSEFVLNFQIKF